MALNSTYSQQQCEKYSIKIADIPLSFNDISVVEASAMLNRYSINLRLFSSIVKEKIIEEYYQTFNKGLYRSL
jgi:hypothetical protein